MSSIALKYWFKIMLVACNQNNVALTVVLFVIKVAEHVLITIRERTYKTIYVFYLTEIARLNVVSKSVSDKYTFKSKSDTSFCKR
jgi:hypothetical protein